MYWYVLKVEKIFSCAIVAITGQRFAILVAKVALAYCLKDFAFDVADNTKVPLELDNGVAFLMNKGDLYLNVTQLSSVDFQNFFLLRIVYFFIII